MNVTATLAGYRARWRFRDSQLVTAWMASRPWEEGGNRVAVFRLSSRDYEHLVIDEIGREARAHEPDAARLRQEILDADDEVEAALLSRFEISAALPRVARLRQLSKVLGSAFWILVIRSAAGAIPVRDAAQDLLETCTKLGERPTAAVIVLHTAAATNESRDLVTGCLVDGILQEAERGQERLWRAFVASRIAWEVGGDLGRAIALDRALPSLRIGDENALERELNRIARHRLGQVPGALKKALDEYVNANCKPLSDRGRHVAAIDAELRDVGLFWRPVGEQRSRAVPWVARALLLENPSSDARHMLRSSLVNAVLANEVLRRCFDLESMLAARLWNQMSALEAQLTDAKRLCDRFSAGRLQENGYYPMGCPAVPGDAWSFASLGEILELSGGRGAGDGVDATKLLRLRNALAHGHYVNWRAVLDVLEVDEQVARSWC